MRARQLAFEDERTLADAIGPLPERVDLLFRGLTERNGADPADMSAGHGLRSFANVWAKTAPGNEPRRWLGRPAGGAREAGWGRSSGRCTRSSTPAPARFGGRSAR